MTPLQLARHLRISEGQAMRFIKFNYSDVPHTFKKNPGNHKMVMDFDKEEVMQYITQKYN